MTEELRYDDLNASIDRIIANGRSASTGDEGVDALARLATGLRGLPSPDFKARLREELAGSPQPGWWSSLASRVAGLRTFSWLKGQRAFLAAGSSSGVVAGACCISGAAASILGLASAAAITEFIHSTLPYFVTLSIAGLIGWLMWFLREQGLTLENAGLTVRRHGFAMAGSYGLVFAASMALTMAMGLY